MDDAIILTDYLPVSFKAPNDQEYISFLWDVFEVNHNSGKYQFAFLAYHMLMMIFAYCKTWQIRQTCPDDFNKALIGFSQDDRKALMGISPLAFSIVGERNILRLFKLIGCTDSQIGVYTKLVQDRNEVAHANGNIYFSHQYDMDKKIQEILQAVEEIHSHSESLINHCYRQFLRQNRNRKQWEYISEEDQIREVLIRGNYLSRKDIRICADFDTANLPYKNKQAIEDLHLALLNICTDML